MLISTVHPSLWKRIPREDRAIKFFHPDFPRDGTLGGAVIQTSTALCFRFPLHLLASISDLFSHASELSQDENDNDAQDQVITLDIVRPEGFYVILSTLQPITQSYTPEDKLNRILGISAQDIIEAFNAADILEISPLILAQMLIPFFTDTFTRFALASGSNDPTFIQSMAEETLNTPFGSMSRKSESILTSLNPSLFVRLRGLHAKRRELPKKVLPTLMSAQALDGVDDFAKICRRKQCEALKSVKGRSWNQLRNRASSDVWAGLIKMGPMACQWIEVADWALEGSCKGCQVCKKRLSDCFGKALEAAKDGLPREL